MKNIDMVIWLLGWYPLIHIADYFGTKTKIIANITVGEEAKAVKRNYALFLFVTWVGVAWLLYQP